MIDTVIFDFDGTLMDTNKIILESWQHTYRTLTGHEGNEDEILKTYGEPLELSLRNAFPDVPSEKSVDIYRKWHRERFMDMIELFPGVIELLEELKARGYKLAIATSRVRETLMQGMNKYQLTDYFDTIVSVEEVSAHKPAPDCVNRVLEKLNSKAENSIMIGDSRLDILCAHNGGVKAVLVGWSATLAGKAIEDFAPGEAPDYIINDTKELLDII